MMKNPDMSPLFPSTDAIISFQSSNVPEPEILKAY